MRKNFLYIPDLPADGFYPLLDRALDIKKNKENNEILKNHCWLLLFDKPSTRTKISFEVAVFELGGHTIYMTPKESQIGRNEALKDTARVLDRYVQGLIVRTFSQDNLNQLVQYSRIPVINALTDKYHPCQVMSDLLTIYERDPDFSSLKIAWVGDGNNVAHSWINAASYVPFDLYIATPRGFEPDKEVLDRAINNGARITCTYDPKEAVKGAKYINTDVWASMGQEEEEKERRELFQSYQVNSDLLSFSLPESRVMHCLPAHRDKEITSEVLDGEKSIVWDQAENRLHMQKALLEWIVS